jgi:hypothetical protein
MDSVKTFYISSTKVADGLSNMATMFGKNHKDEKTSAKYGIDISNDVFAMHPYCWCDNPECPWCHEIYNKESGSTLEKSAPNFWYKPTDLKIWWYKYIGREMESNREFSDDEWHAIEKACLLSLINK